MTLIKQYKNIISWVMILAIAIGIYVYRNPSTNFDKDATVGIQFFRGSWSEVLAKAQKENKPIFLDVYATWCGSCKRLKEYVLSNKKVGASFNNNFINVSLNAEIGEGVIISNQFNIESYPSLLFINKDGTLNTKYEGYLNATALIKLGKQHISN